MSEKKTLLIGEKGQFIWSLFLPLSALCALSSTPFSFSKRNGPTIEILLIIEETKLKTQILKLTASCFNLILSLCELRFILEANKHIFSGTSCPN